MKCPGQDLRFWKPGDIFDISCPKCGGKIEFFKDDVRRKCKSCGARITNPKIDFSCAEWCAYAEQCVGELPRELREKRRGLLKDRIALAVKKIFGRDEKRINHANRVVQFAEEILKVEGGDPAVVVAASYLHDIGIHEAEKKYHSPAGHYQEMEGPPIARSLLEKLGVEKDLIDEVCDIIAHHHSPGKIQTLNFQILWEADSLVNLLEEEAGMEPYQIREVVEATFRTPTGKRLAKAFLLDKRENPTTERKG
jgi:hypothetical protein